MHMKTKVKSVHFFFNSTFGQNFGKSKPFQTNDFAIFSMECRVGWILSEFTIHYFICIIALN